MELCNNASHIYAVEKPVELWVNNKKITTFFCTPSDLHDLAVGHLLTRGYIFSVSEITELSYDPATAVIRVIVSRENPQSLISVSEMILSGCSAVSEFSDQVYRLKPVPSDYTTSLGRLKELGDFMIDHGTIYQTTGGVHAALLESGHHSFVREDIGRHNAVDKVIGAAARADVLLTYATLVTTGRISLDMALKAASVSIPVVATLKCPSDLGIRLAKHYHICIVTKILSDCPIIYTAEEKIIQN